MAGRKNKLQYLLGYEEGAQGYRKYDVTANKVSDAEAKALAQQINNAIRRLEKAGIEEQSAEYLMMKHYAASDPNGKGKIYNITPSGDIRLTKDMRGMTAKERAYYINTMRNILNSKTYTVTGTKAAMKKSFEHYQSTAAADRPGMTYDKYTQVWKTYREKIANNKKNKIGSDLIELLLERTSIYDMEPEEMAEAMEYMELGEDEGISALLDAYPQLINWQ